MRDIRAWLKQGDPLNAQPGLSVDEAQVMRRAVVAAATESNGPDWAWPRPLLIAATLGVALAIGVGLGTGLRPRDGSAPPIKTQTIERRQIRFETPGGTRIIWVLSSDFEL